MPLPQKGKTPTKGSKQILVENAATVTFYRNMALGSTLLYAICISFLYPDDEISMWLIVSLNVLAIGIQIGCYQMMRYISRPKYSDNSQLVDPGLDLNMEGGMAEHIKDIVILVSITQVFTLMSSYFWFLLLLLPSRAFWLIWTNFVVPWFLEEAPADTEIDDKKRRKIERKMKRYQY